jgi:hypothetical protein
MTTDSTEGLVASDTCVTAYSIRATDAHVGASESGRELLEADQEYKKVEGEKEEVEGEKEEVEVEMEELEGEEEEVKGEVATRSARNMEQGPPELVEHGPQEPMSIRHHNEQTMQQNGLCGARHNSPHPAGHVFPANALSTRVVAKALPRIQDNSSPIDAPPETFVDSIVTWFSSTPHSTPRSTPASTPASTPRMWLDIKMPASVSSSDLDCQGMDHSQALSESVWMQNPLERAAMARETAQAREWINRRGQERDRQAQRLSLLRSSLKEAALTTSRIEQDAALLLYDVK